MKNFYILIIICLLPSCTFNKRKADKEIARINTRVIENNEAISIINDDAKENLEYVSYEIKSLKGTSFGLTNSLNQLRLDLNLENEFLTENTRLLGLPVKSQVDYVQGLLNQDKGSLKQQNKRQGKAEQWNQDLKIREETLKNMGAIYEKERNDKIVKRLKWGGIGIGAIALLGLMVYFSGPLMGALPLLSKATNLIPMNFLTNKVKSVGTILTSLKQNPDKTATFQAFSEMLKNQLRKDEDSSDHLMVKHVKIKNNI